MTKPGGTLLDPAARAAKMSTRWRQASVRSLQVWSLAGAASEHSVLECSSGVNWRTGGRSSCVLLSIILVLRLVLMLSKLS